MQIKLSILVIATFLLQATTSPAQTVYTPIKVDTTLKDTFSFATLWKYDWEVMKDADGKFTRTDDRPITPADTLHYFYTANCTTNVQGGYNINYCQAQKQKQQLILTFSDGLPAYASTFRAYIRNNRFYFSPAIVYPLLIPGQHITYTVTKQNLTVSKSNYKSGDLLLGYIDVTFIEKVSVPGKLIQIHEYYFKGFIRTKVNHK